jgi:hypothetical protein
MGIQPHHLKTFFYVEKLSEAPLPDWIEGIEGKEL